MRAAGMTHATVANAGTSEASRALYEACGFEPWHVIDEYGSGVGANTDPGSELYSRIREASRLAITLIVEK